MRIQKTKAEQKRKESSERTECCTQPRNSIEEGVVKRRSRVVEKGLDDRPMEGVGRREGGNKTTTNEGEDRRRQH